MVPTTTKKLFMSSCVVFALLSLSIHPLKSSSSHASDLDMEWRTIHVLITPLDIENVLTRIYEFVADSVLPVSLMLDIHLIAWFLWTVDTNEEDVVASSGAVDGERVLFTEDRAINAWTLTFDRAGVGLKTWLDWNGSTGGPGS